MPVVPRVAKPFGSSLLESYWPEVEHLSNGLGSAVSFKIPTFRYAADLNELFALAKGWVIARWVSVGVKNVLYQVPLSRTDEPCGPFGPAPGDGFWSSGRGINLLSPPF